jgi:hypothetical protein
MRYPTRDALVIISLAVAMLATIGISWIPSTPVRTITLLFFVSAVWLWGALLGASCDYDA